MENKKLEEMNLPESVKVAVKWWSNKLRYPMTVKQNNGEPSQVNMFTTLQMMAAINTNFKEEDVQTFEIILAEKIMKDLNARKSVRLSVDYHPDTVLSEALDNSVKDYLSMNVFPCKTYMKVSSESTKVSEGYGADFELLYPVIKD